MNEGAAAQAPSLFGYAVDNLALVEEKIITNLDPFTNSWWLNVILPVVLLTAVTLGLHFLLGGRGWKEHTKGLWPLVVDKDRRLSTSKVQLMLWTFAIVLALLLLLFFGKDFGALELQPEYLLLLGSPAASAILAKTFTNTKVSTGAVENTVAEEPALKDVVSDDEGNTDLFDFQYFLFNLVLLLWFAVAVFRTLHDPTRLEDEAYFLPPLPLSLVGLTSASAASYVVKKGLEAERPILRAAYPSVAAPHDEVRLTGQYLRLTSAAPEAGQPAQAPTAVTFGGKPASISLPLRENPQGYDEIGVVVPADVTPGPAHVQFTRADGTVNDPLLQFQIVSGGPTVFSVSPDRLVLSDDPQEITIAGSGFGEPDPGAPPQANRVTLGGVPLTIPDGYWTSERIRAHIPALAQARQLGLTAQGKYDLIVVDRHGRASSPKQIELSELAPTISSVQPEHVVLDHEPNEVTILGANFGGPDDAGSVTLDGRPLEGSGTAQWDNERVRVVLPPLREVRQRGFAIPGEYDLIIKDRHGHSSNAARLRLDWLPPMITGVYPSTGKRGQHARLFGQNLAVPDDSQPGTPQVLFDNMSAGDFVQRGDGEYEVTVPQDLDTGTRNVKFVRSDGTPTGEFPFQVVKS